MSRRELRSALASSAAYFTNFGALAASAPFLAVVLREAGFSDEAAAECLAALLVVRWLAIPAWTHLADRLRSIPRVVQIVSALALVAFAPLALRLPLVAVVAALVFFAAFRAPFGPLLDAFTLGEEAEGGARFGLLRAWGTAGYMLAALATGALVARMGGAGVVAATLAMLALATVASFALPPRTLSTATHEERVRVVDFVRRPRVAALFAVALLHQVGLAPYDALFPAYLTPIAGATAAGLALALGAGAEFVLMLAGASLPRRWGGARLVRIACVASAARWAIVGVTRTPALLVAAQSLHAFTFGAFYLGAVALMNEESPKAQRALGQGIFSAWAFGIAAAVCLSLAGVVERAWGMQGVFRVGAVASLLSAVIPLGRPRST